MVRFKKKRLKLHTRIFIHMQTWCISGGQWALILLQKEEGTLVFLGKAACVLHVGDGLGPEGRTIVDYYINIPLPRQLGPQAAV